MSKRCEEPPASAGAMPKAPDHSAGMCVISHDVLFGHADEVRCDACDQPIAAGEGDEGSDLPGEGVYMWARGDEVRFERAPLCAACASAIGMTALARWEIEEEEG